jgi:hypothetical protein
VDAGLFQLELVTEGDQEFIGWFISQTEVYEGLDKSGHFIENQILIGFHLLLLLVLIGGDETLDRVEAFLKDGFLRSGHLEGFAFTSAS